MKNQRRQFPHGDPGRTDDSKIAMVSWTVLERKPVPRGGILRLGTGAREIFTQGRRRKRPLHSRELGGARAPPTPILSEKGARAKSPPSKQPLANQSRRFGRRHSLDTVTSFNTSSLQTYVGRKTICHFVKVDGPQTAKSAPKKPPGAVQLSRGQPEDRVRPLARRVVGHEGRGDCTMT
jgi:hypothetical protein